MITSNLNNSNQNINFKAGFVTLAEKNLGKHIDQNIVDVFNKSQVPELLKETKSHNLSDKANYFITAAGAGSRFNELAQIVGNHNKISLPFPVQKDKNLHMLDFPMALGKSFIGKEGYNTIIAKKPSGNLGDIVNYYLKKPEEIKDTIICGGDNIYGIKTEELTHFFEDTIKNKDKHIALLGVERTPEEIDRRFGILLTKPNPENLELYSLKGFKEKPPKEIAEKHTNENNKNIANTGMYYISKEAMGKLIGEIKNEISTKGQSTIIKKNDTEIYDVANAIKLIHKKSAEWFNTKPEKIADIKMVEKWEDVGEPKAYYRFLEGLKVGEYLQNFSKNFAKKVRNSALNRVILNKKEPIVIFNPKYNTINDVPQQKLKASKTVEGTKIIV